jgi:hypothetical protein
MPATFGNSDAGAFPLAGPLTYLRVPLAEIRDCLQSAEFAPVSIWFHATSEHAARAAAAEGLIPSCWCGGDSCCVFGHSSFDEMPRWRRQDWVVEIESRALPGQLRAWWVPPQAIRGVWHDGQFFGRDELEARSGVAELVSESCPCDLHGLTSEQIARWRAVSMQ